jgi:hypothetical protein
MPTETANVQKAMKALAENPAALKSLHQVLNEASSKAGVSLSIEEKAQVLQNMASQVLAKNAAVIGWV